MTKNETAANMVFESLKLSNFDIEDSVIILLYALVYALHAEDLEMKTTELIMKTPCCDTNYRIKFSSELIELANMPLTNERKH